MARFCVVSLRKENALTFRLPQQSERDCEENQGLRLTLNRCKPMVYADGDSMQLRCRIRLQTHNSHISHHISNEWIVGERACGIRHSGPFEWISGVMDVAYSVVDVNYRAIYCETRM